MNDNIKEILSFYDTRMDGERLVIFCTDHPFSFIHHYNIMTSFLELLQCQNIRVAADSKYVEGFVVPRLYLEISGEIPSILIDKIKLFFRRADKNAESSD